MGYMRGKLTCFAHCNIDFLSRCWQAKANKKQRFGRQHGTPATWMRTLFEVCSMVIVLLLTGRLTIGTGGCVSFYFVPFAPILHLFALCLFISIDKRELADIYPGAKVVLTVSVFSNWFKVISVKKQTKGTQHMISNLRWGNHTAGTEVCPLWNDQMHTLFNIFFEAFASFVWSWRTKASPFNNL